MCQCVFASSVGSVSVCHDCIPTWGIRSFCCAHPGTAKKRDEEEEEEQEQEQEEEEREEEEGACCF